MSRSTSPASESSPVRCATKAKTPGECRSWSARNASRPEAVRARRTRSLSPGSDMKSLPGHHDTREARARRSDSALEPDREGVLEDRETPDLLDGRREVV